MILKTLKAEALNLMHVHSTISGLRRACSRGNVVLVEATDELPRLYYVTVDGKESIHALTSDLTKFLMAKHISTVGGDELYSLKGIIANWVKTESDYNKYVDPEYRSEYTWEQSKDSMPWLVINFIHQDKADQTESVEDTSDASEEDEPSSVSEDSVKATISMKPSVVFGGTSSNVGTVSEDKKSIEVDAKKYLMFEAKNDLGLEDAVELTVKVETEDAIYTAKAEVE